MGETTRARHPFLDWPGPIAMAHRGGSGEQPENTMAAFQHAVDLGYRYLETDVRVTADGVAVAFHDEDLQRTCDRPARVADLPWREVATARVHGREPIPRLDDVFAAFPEARLNIDCKDDRSLEPLVAVVRRFDALDRVLVGAFDDRRTRRLRQRLGPRLCTPAGAAEVAMLRALGWAPPGPLAVQIPIRRYGIPLATDGFLRRAHGRGLHVHVWTIDVPTVQHELLDLGVDGIMTDHPTVLRDVLVQRDEWPT